MTVREFAEKLGVKSKDLIRYFIDRGMMATINHIVEPDLAVEIAEQIGCSRQKVTRRVKELQNMLHRWGKDTAGY